MTISQLIRQGANPPVAETILKQLGGSGKLKAMIGAKSFIDMGNGLNFKFPNPNPKKPNYVEIVLDPRDTYIVTFGLVKGLNYKVLKTFKEIQVSSLKPLFEKETELRLSL